MRNDDLESFAKTLNDIDKHYPKSRSRCFDIGIWGGCGVDCPAFIDGECSEPQEISSAEIIGEHGQDEAELIAAKYPGVWPELNKQPGGEV